jgi:pilus assembly protein CpaE
MSLAEVLNPARREAASGFLAAVADEVTRETVRQVAAQFGWPARAVREGGVAAARALLEGSAAPEILLVDVSESGDPLAAIDGLADHCEPGTKVVVLGQTNDVALYRSLMRLGVSDYLVKPLSAEALAETLRRMQRPLAAAPSAKTARVIAVIGARGGVGATSLAVSTAWGLANHHQQKTVLLDLDMQFGAAALTLDVEPGRGLRDILVNPERIDGLLVSSAMTRVGDRLRVMGAEEPLEDEIQIGPEGLRALLAALADACEAVVIDTPRRTDALTREVLARADAVAIVTDLSLPAMRDAQRLVRLARALKPGREVTVIANRVGGVSGEIPQAEFVRGVGAPIDIVAPADPKAAEAGAEHAKPLIETAAKSPLGAELRRLTTRLSGQVAPFEAEPAPEDARAWLKRVLGR